jgi:FG-GAP repeat
MALDLEGGLLAVGAPNYATPQAPGSTHVFRLDPTGWLHEVELKSTLATGRDLFGGVVALSAGRILVGAPADDFAGPNSGRAYLYEYQAGSWIEAARFDAPPSTTAGRFGWEVAIEGDLAVISAPENRRFFIYTRDGAGVWSMDQEIIGTPWNFGRAVAIDGGRIFLTSSPDIEVYGDVGGTWSVTTTIPSPPGEYFYNVAVEGNLLAVAHIAGGCPDGGSCAPGDVFVYHEVGGAWIREAILVGSNTPHESLLGAGLSVSGGRILAGTAGLQEFAGTGETPGAAYLFVETPSGWLQQFRLRSLKDEYDEGFAGNVILDGERAVCSGLGYFDQAAQLGSGAVYAFDGLVPAVRHLCFGTNCPCGGLGSGGCGNSASNGNFGSGGMLEFLGGTSVTADDLILRSSGLPPNEFGLVFMGAGTTDVPLADGRRCVAPGAAGLFRFPVHSTGGLGAFEQGPGLVGTSMGFGAGGTIAVGSTWYFQGWFRDPSGTCGNGSNLTTAIAVTFVP